MENSMKVPQKSKSKYHMIQQLHSSVYTQKKMKTLIRIDIGIKMFIETLFTIVKKKKNGSNPSAHQQTPW